jgi:peroxiredoxin
VRIAKFGLAVVLVVVVALLGLFSGRLIRRFALPAGNTTVTMPAPTSLLKRGAPFPDVVVLLPGSVSAFTSALLSPRGGVVLFLDLECPPCIEMAAKWQTILDQGAVEELSVLGVANQPPHIIEEYVAAHGIRFPIVADTSHTFLREYEVDRFPLEVVVSRTGKIVSTSYDSARAVDVEALRTEIGN